MNSKATRILVVDDNPDILEVFAALLRIEGYDVLEASTGTAALQITRDKRPDLVLLDVNLPDFNGTEVCRQIKSDPILQDVFVILISGDATSVAHKVGGLATGADDYLAKPMAHAEFLARIRTVVRLRHTTAALRASEQQYRQLIEILPDAVGVVNLEGRWLRVNPQAAVLFGYADVTELLSRSIFDLTPREDHARLQTHIAGALAKGGLRDAEYNWVRRDGSRFQVELNATVLNDSREQAIGLVIVGRDITERKRAEAARRESEARKSAIMEAALDGIITIDHKGRIVELNFAAEKTFGYQRERVIGQEMAPLLLPPSLREWFQRGLDGSFTSDEGPFLSSRIEMVALRAHRVEFPAEFSITAIDLDGPPMYTAFFRDISGRKRAETQLATLGHAIESTSEPIWIIDTQNRFTFTNRAFQETYDYNEREIIGQRTDVLFSEESPVSLHAEILDRTRLGGWRGEVLHRRKDGSQIPIFLSTSLIKDQAGRVIGLMGVGQDITARKHAEEQIRLLADALQSANEPISITDEANHFTFVNRAFVESYGYTEEEILGKTPHFLYARHNTPGLCDHIFHSTRRGGWSGELTNRRKDGSEFPITLSTSPIRGRDGKIVGLVGVARDVSERKRVEKQISAFSLLGYRLSSATAPDQSAQIILEVASELFGWDAGYVDLCNLKEDKITPILAMDTIDGQRVPVRSSSPSGTPSALMRLVMKDGMRMINGAGDGRTPVKLVRFGDVNRRSASRMYVPIHARGAVLGVLSIQSYTVDAYNHDDLKLLQTLADHCGNALERIRVGEALREAEVKYRSIFENATEGIFRMTPDGHLLSANPALADMFGYKSPDDISSNVSKAGRQIFVNLKKRAELKRLLELRGSVQEFEAENSRADGSKIWISANVHVVRDAKRAILYYEGTIQDVTERKRAEEELRQLPLRIIEAQESERLRVARELHDGVNQILASAKMRLRKVEENAATLSPATREILRRCSGLLVQALEENRRIAHNLRPSDLDELGLTAACRHYCQELEARTGLDVKCTIAPLDQRLHPTFELNLFRIVQESLNNVEKHAHAKKVAVRLALRGQTIVLTVQDDGRGFGQDKPKLGEKKRRGIGLTNLRERATHLGGTFEVESRPNRGTKITVQAPVRLAG